MTVLKRLAILAATAIPVLVASPSGGWAAPQVLALLATEGPMALACDGARCVAELPSLCLQPERRAPEAGRVYHALNGDALRLVGTAADGTERALPLPPEARLTALRTHVAVALSVPRTWVDAHFATLDGITVASLSPLAPQALATDAAPMSPAELQVARSELTAVAEIVFATAPESLAATRIAGRMVNLLADQDEMDDDALAAAWRNAGGPLADADGGASVPSRARFDYEFCRFGTRSGLAASAKACFQAQHDGALEYIYARYVKALRAGS
jgi:hypothetical protein